MCVYERERERETVCVCERERDRVYVCKKVMCVKCGRMGAQNREREIKPNKLSASCETD